MDTSVGHAPKAETNAFTIRVCGNKTVKKVETYIQKHAI